MCPSLGASSGFFSVYANFTHSLYHRRTGLSRTFAPTVRTVGMHLEAERGPAVRPVPAGVLSPQRFLKEATFSLFTKAFMASFWSSVEKHRPKASVS